MNIAALRHNYLRPQFSIGPDGALETTTADCSAHWAAISGVPRRVCSCRCRTAATRPRVSPEDDKREADVEAVRRRPGRPVLAKGRSLVTFDYDFFDPSKLPDHRNPGVVILDCDRGRQREVDAAIFALGAFEKIVGPVTRRMRVIIRSDGEVSVWDKSDSRAPADRRYRFQLDRAPLVWES